MTNLGKLAAGALLMAGTAIGATAVTTTPASARVVVGIGVGVPGYYPYYGYPCGYYGYCGYPAYYGYGYGGPYAWWGGRWHWRAGFHPGFRGRFGFHHFRR